ncbi:MAG: hypothetical protein ACHQQS_01935 [Thermoanaerobaculales bacterium]
MRTRSSGKPRAGARVIARRQTLATKPDEEGHVDILGTLCSHASDATIEHAHTGVAYPVVPKPGLFGSTIGKPIAVPFVTGTAKTFPIGTRIKAGCCDAGQAFAKGGFDPRLIPGP